MLLEGGPREYIHTLARCKSKLDIKRIVPGHGPIGKPEEIDHLINYLWWLLREVDEAIRLGLTRDAAIEAITLPKRFLIPRFSPASRVNPLIQNFHRLNVMATYQALSNERGDPSSIDRAA